MNQKIWYDLIKSMGKTAEGGFSFIKKLVIFFTRIQKENCKREQKTVLKQRI